MDDIKTCYRCGEPLFDGEEHLCTIETPEEDTVPFWDNEKEEEQDE